MDIKIALFITPLTFTLQDITFKTVGGRNYTFDNFLKVIQRFHLMSTGISNMTHQKRELMLVHAENWAIHRVKIYKLI